MSATIHPPQPGTNRRRERDLAAEGSNECRLHVRSNTTRRRKMHSGTHELARIFVARSCPANLHRRRVQVGAGSVLLALLLLLGVGNARAAELNGVSLPDSSTLDGHELVLNGLGQRIVLMFVKAYVAGLYLPEKTTDAKQAIDSDVPKQIVMKFQRSVSGEEMRSAMRESLAAAGANPALAARVKTFESYFSEPLDVGDQVALDYLPGTGTSVVVDGKPKGTLEGADFMRALVAIWLGSKPPNQSLKDGLLGDP